MIISTEVLRHHVAYTAWASARLMESASQLSDEELTRDFHTADRNVVGTLAHIFGADRVWLARFKGIASPASATDEDRSIAVLKSEWPLLHASWAEWVAGLAPSARSNPTAF